MKGVGLKLYCSECSRSIKEDNSEEFLIFKCKHIFHKECIKEKNCKFCSKSDILKSCDFLKIC